MTNVEAQPNAKDTPTFTLGLNGRTRAAGATSAWLSINSSRRIASIWGRALSSLSWFTHPANQERHTFLNATLDKDDGLALNYSNAMYQLSQESKSGVSSSVVHPFHVTCIIDNFIHHPRGYWEDGTGTVIHSECKTLPEMHEES